MHILSRGAFPRSSLHCMRYIYPGFMWNYKQHGWWYLSYVPIYVDDLSTPACRDTYTPDLRSTYIHSYMLTAIYLISVVCTVHCVPPPDLCICNDMIFRGGHQIKNETEVWQMYLVYVVKQQQQIVGYVFSHLSLFSFLFFSFFLFFFANQASLEGRE